MGQQKGEKKLDKVLNGKDVVVTAFGAMIGWGWGVSTGVIGYKRREVLEQFLDLSWVE